MKQIRLKPGMLVRLRHTKEIWFGGDNRFLEPGALLLIVEKPRRVHNSRAVRVLWKNRTGDIWLPSWGQFYNIFERAET